MSLLDQLLLALAQLLLPTANLLVIALLLALL